MPRPCTVCSHAERPAIDQELADAISYRDIARHYGVSKSSLLRHSQQCAPTVVPITGHVTGQAPAQHQCPCTRINWHALAHDAQQFNAYIQKAQTPEQAVHYMQFFLQRFATLTESIGAT
jgi:hypothetical protein